jgi:hypothetical protein
MEPAKMTPTEVKEKMTRDKLQTVEYMNHKKNHIVTTRFNNETWHENTRFRERNKVECVYCSPKMNTTAIPIDSLMFVLEMNNSTNKIMGIGLVRNHPKTNYSSVYSNNNFNRYVYVGKLRIDRSTMSEEEEKIMQAFDILCFTGNKHMKRGHGMTAFPPNMLARCARNKMDLVDYVTNMFRIRKSGNIRVQETLPM